MSARALPFLVVPLLIMVIAILMNGSTPAFSGSSTAQICTQQNCPPPGSTGTSYFCQANNLIGLLQACKILPNCNAPPYPQPAFCIQDAISAAGAGCFFQFLANGAAGCGVFLPSNSFVFIPTAQITSSLSSTAAFFTFTASGTSGFITIIGVATAIISLLGLTVFGSGEQGEGLHVLFMGGMVLGLWLVVSGIEGYVSGSPNELFFDSLNSAIQGAGTFVYAMLTLSVVIGFTGLVSRGS